MLPQQYSPNWIGANRGFANHGSQAVINAIKEFDKLSLRDRIRRGQNTNTP